MSTTRRIGSASSTRPPGAGDPVGGMSPEVRPTPLVARTARSELLARFSHAANLSVGDVDRLLRLLAQRVSDLMGDACAISLVSEDGEWLDLVALRGRDPEQMALASQVLTSSRNRVDEGTDGRVIRTGETFFLPRVHGKKLRPEVKAEYRELLDRLTVHSLITVPLLVRGRAIGTTTVARLSAGAPYDDEDRVFLEELADRVAVAIDNARLYAARLGTEASLRDSEERLRLAAETAKARVAQQAVVAELGRRALSELDLDGLMAAAAVAVADCLGDEYCEIVELNAGGDELRVRAGAGWKEGAVSVARVPVGRSSHAGYALIAGEAVIVEDLAVEDRFIPPPLLLDHDVVSSASVIIGLDGHPYGVLSTHSTQPRRFTSDEVNFLQSVANLLAVGLVRLRNEELQERAQHQDRLAAIGRLAAGVAHDFNNIVTVISVCAQLLQSQDGLDENGREQLGHIRREAERAASLIWQILDFAHRGPITRTPVDLDRFFVDFVPVLRRVQPARISIAFSSDTAEHRAMADAGRLEQILSNLAANACDAIPADGHIEIALSRENVACETSAPVPGMAPGAWIRIGFADTGTGIAPELLPRIFEPFFSTRLPGHGTGLGLAQVYGLVSQHGGHIDVSSTVGEGTTVSFWIPAL